MVTMSKFNKKKFRLQIRTKKKNLTVTMIKPWGGLLRETADSVALVSQKQMPPLGSCLLILLSGDLK